MCDKCGRQFRGKAGYVVHVKFCGQPKKKKETKKRTKSEEETKKTGRTKTASTEACAKQSAKPVKQQAVKVDRKDQEPMSPPKTKRGQGHVKVDRSDMPMSPPMPKTKRGPRKKKVKCLVINLKI